MPTPGEHPRKPPRCATLRYAYQRESWFLDGVALYVDAVHRLARDLSQLDLHSRGLLAVRDHLLDYVASDAVRAPCSPPWAAGTSS
ncbi:MAG: hypothetical protein ACRDQV_09370 [Pseudonocardiaceae bacterium]